MHMDASRPSKPSPRSLFLAINEIQILVPATARLVWSSCIQQSLPRISHHKCFSPKGHCCCTPFERRRRKLGLRWYFGDDPTMQVPGGFREDQGAPQMGTDDDSKSTTGSLQVWFFILLHMNVHQYNPLIDVKPRRIPLASARRVHNSRCV